jgi:Fe2+ or Zn2+ uptake regulation protein
MVYPGTVSQDAGGDARRAGSPDAVEDALARMRERGGRATSARRLLLGALVAKSGHLSAEELAAAAHGHLLCLHCGSMTEVPGEMFGDLARTARDRHGFRVEPHRFAVIGACATCQ